jgi:hypothetical protein
LSGIRGAPDARIGIAIDPGGRAPLIRTKSKWFLRKSIIFAREPEIIAPTPQDVKALNARFRACGKFSAGPERGAGRMIQ